MAECVTLLPNMTAEYNATACGAGEPGEQPRFPAYVRVLVTVACALVMAVGVVGNMLVPLVIWRNRELRNSTNFFLLNLSLADLLVLLLCMPKVLVEVHTRPEVWVLGRTVCLLVPFLEQVVVNVSVLTIMAISIERYYAICKPLRAGYTWTKMRALVVIVIVWVAAMVTSSPILWITEYKMVNYVDHTKVPVCITVVNNTLYQSYYISKDVTFFFLPVLVLLGLYSVITLHLVREPRISSQRANFRVSRSHDPRDGSETSTYRARKQVVFMLIAVIVCFFFFMLPSCMFRLFIIVASDESILSLGWELYHNINFFCRIMTYVNCSMNPILYNVMSSKFREAFLKVLGMPAASRHLSRQSTFNTASSTNSSRLNSVLRADYSPAASAAHRYGRQSSCVSVVSRTSGATRKEGRNSSSAGAWPLERVHSRDASERTRAENGVRGLVVEYSQTSAPATHSTASRASDTNDACL